jgi:serine/threonine-protein kinase
MVTYAGLTKLVDFGVAKTAASMSRTRAGVLKGKVAYMAPEQARSDTNIDERADVFAVGLLVWELLTGKRLWEGYSEAKVFERLLDKDPLPRMRSLDPEIPEDLDTLCVKAMEKEKEDRFATANDLLDEIERACAKYDLRASDREIGLFVTGLFEAEREKVKALVSSSIAKPKEEPTHSLLPQANRSLDPVPPREDSDPFLWTALSSGSLSNPLSISSIKGESLPAETPTSLVEATRHPPPEPTGPATSHARLALGGAGLVALLGMAVLAGTRFGGAPKRETPEPVMVASHGAPQTPPPEVPAEVSIDVVVKPVTAKLYVDGNLVSNPYQSKAVRGENSHEVRAEADGYETKSMTVRWDRDRSIDLSLTKTPPQSPSSLLAARPPAPALGSAPPPASTYVAPPIVAGAPKSSAGSASSAPAEPASSSVVGRSAQPPPRGISEIDPTRTKRDLQHDKIDTDVFRR